MKSIWIKYIEYEVSSCCADEDDDCKDLAIWEGNGIKFSALLEDDYALMDGKIAEFYCDDRHLNRVKEYLQRCNNYIGLV